MSNNTQQATGKKQISLIRLKDTEKMYLNTRYGKVANIVDERTTEQKTATIRKMMRFYRPCQTACRGHGRIDGWYYTEPETIYGECIA